MLLGREPLPQIRLHVQVVPDPEAQAIRGEAAAVQEPDETRPLVGDLVLLDHPHRGGALQFLLHATGQEVRRDAQLDGVADR